MTDIHKISIEGEFSIFSAQAVQAQLLSALDQGGEIEVDLSRVSDMDSAGLQLMVAARKEAGLRNKTLVFTGHSPAVLATLDLSDFSGHFGDPLLHPRT